MSDGNELILSEEFILNEIEGKYTIMIAHPPLALASVTHKGMLSGAGRDPLVFLLEIFDEQR